MSDVNNSEKPAREIPDLATALNLLEQAEQERDRLKNVVEYTGEHLKRWADDWEKVRSFIQVSINREDWSASELEEPFWEELAEMLNLDLNLTEEVEVTFTATWSGTVTVKKGADLDGLRAVRALEWDFNVGLDGDTVGNLTLDGTDFDY